jgi:DNA-binding MarR family transcriptional regulator/GNAT superfamily N-acetyltransferase
MTKIEAEVGAVRAFNRFHTRWAGALNETLLATEHSLTEARVIFELARREATPTGELRAELGMDSGHLSRVLDALERQGLIERRAVAGDGRRRDVRLTEAGTRAAAELDRRSTDEIGGRLEALDPGDRLRLVDGMAAVRSVLDGDRATPVVHIRAPRPGDLGWIAQAHGTLYAAEYGWSQLFEAYAAKVVGEFGTAQDPRSGAWIAEVDGAPAGCVLCLPREDGDAQLRLLLVAPRARRLGIGERLVRTCIDFARDQGYPRLMLWTNAPLTSARRIYERLGFELVERNTHTLFGPELEGQTWTLDLEATP